MAVADTSGSPGARNYLDRFTAWGRAERSIRGVILMGSLAKAGAGDSLSDLDLMVITARPWRLSSPSWLGEIQPSPLFSWTYLSPIGGQTVRQAIYEGPLVVDIAVVPAIQSFLAGLAVVGLSRESLRRYVPSALSTQLDAWIGITRRGAKVLLDKDGLARRMLAAPSHASASDIPTEETFLNNVHSVFGLILWESKQLIRQELWMALGTVDHQIKKCLLTMMEWHSVAKNRAFTDTWYGGRRVNEWADSRWTTALPQTWSGYSVDAAWTALVSTLDLFSDMAKETAECLHYRYPVDDERRVRDWISARRAVSTGEACD